MLQGVALNREPFCSIQQVAWNIVVCNVALCMLGLRNILSIRPSQTRRQLTRSVKTSNTTSDTQQMKDHLLNSCATALHLRQYSQTSTSDLNHYCGSPRHLVFLRYSYYSLLILFPTLIVQILSGGSQN